MCGVEWSVIIFVADKATDRRRSRWVWAAAGAPACSTAQRAAKEKQARSHLDPVPSPPRSSINFSIRKLSYAPKAHMTVRPPLSEKAKRFGFVSAGAVTISAKLHKEVGATPSSSCARAKAGHDWRCTHTQRRGADTPPLLSRRCLNTASRSRSRLTLPTSRARPSRTLRSRSASLPSSATRAACRASTSSRRFSEKPLRVFGDSGDPAALCATVEPVPPF